MIAWWAWALRVPVFLGAGSGGSEGGGLNLLPGAAGREEERREMREARAARAVTPAAIRAIVLPDF